MRFPRIAAIAAVLVGLFAVPARAESIRITFGSVIGDFSSTDDTVYPELASVQPLLLGDLFYDPANLYSTGIFSVAGYGGTFAGMTMLSDDTGTLLDTASLAALPASATYGLYFDGTSTDGSSLFFNIALSGVASSAFDAAGSFRIAPGGLSDFGSTTGGLALFNAPLTTDPSGPVVSPVPLPASLPMFGTALFGLIVIGYHTKRQASRRTVTA